MPPTSISNAVAAAEKNSDSGPEPSYGKIVTGFKTFTYKADDNEHEPFEFVHGGQLEEFTLAYETWGTLNSRKDNVILLHTGLSASSHAKSQPQNQNPGWW